MSEVLPSHLDAPSALRAWFETAHLRIPNHVRAEIESRNTGHFETSAWFNLSSHNVLASITVVVTGYAGRSLGVV